MMKKFLIPVLLFISIQPMWAQESGPELEVGLMIRPRTEFRNGSFTVKSESDAPAYFISQRSRLNIRFGLDRLKIGVGAQNIRVWGGSSFVAPNEGSNTMIHEAWAQYELINNLYFKAGRQGLIYDDDRILGGLDWHQHGRWHDVALLKYEPEGHVLHAGFAYNQNAEFKLNNFYNQPRNNYKTMQFLWYERPLGDAYKSTVLFLNTGYQVPADSSVAYQQTIGGNLYKTSGDLVFTGSFYYQSGQNPAGQDISAWMASVYGSYQFIPRWRIHFGMDYLTGDDMDDPDAGRTHEFIPRYGTNHKFYGLMDYFYVGVPHEGVGLWDKYLGVSGEITRSLSMKLIAHHFNSASVIRTVEDLSSYIGTELDLTFNWVVSKEVKLVGGYSQMFSSDSMETLKGGGDHTLFHNWIWGMLVVDATIFNLKKNNN